MRASPEEPCRRCGVRADVGCKHRPAEGTMPLAIEFTETPFDGRATNRFVGPGTAFHMRELSARTREVRDRLAGRK